jgi:hypothetical protein
MLEFIKKHKRLLLSYRVVLRILGWILLCMSIVGFAMLYTEYFQTGGKVTLDGTFGMFKRSYSYFFNIGLISLGLAQLIRYLCGDRMGLLLCFGDKILYLYAIIAVWQDIVQAWFVATGKMGGGNSWHLQWFMFTLPITLVYRIAEVLIFIGLGLFLKQLIEALEASKLKLSQTNDM